jgi:hypothetical protein
MPNPTEPKPNPVPAILVYGTPTNPALTQASWFRAEDKEAVKAAAEALKFSVIELQTDADRALAAGAHEGVLKSSGRMIVGSVSAEVYRRIEEHVRKGAGTPDPSKSEDAAAITTKPMSEQTKNSPHSAHLATSKPDPVGATDAWDRLQIGSYVVGKYWESDGTPCGWWLGIITEIDKNDFFIRWPDEPLKPALKIERKHVAILHPTYDVRASGRSVAEGVAVIITDTDRGGLRVAPLHFAHAQEIRRRSPNPQPQETKP